MVDRNWARRVTRAAASTARDRVLDTVDRGATLARSVGGATGQATTGVRELITNIEGPRLPLREAWGIGLGQILGGHPGLAPSLRGAVGQLDRLARLEISPEAIRLDGDELRWEKVDEIRFGPVLDVLTAHALQHEAERLTRLLPPVPGRRWLVRQTLGVLVALCLAAAGPGPDEDPGPETAAGPENASGPETAAGPEAEAGPEPAAGGTTPGIPVSISYRGLARRKELSPGVFAALVAASTPNVSAAIMATAAERGIRVTVAPPPRSHAQARLRRLAAGVSSRIGHADHPPAIAAGDDEWVDPDGKA